MKKLLYLPVVVILASCYQQHRECAGFRTGTFRFEDEINGVKKTSEFERTETLQVETFEGKTDTSSVRWINDCEFVLQKLHPKNMEQAKAVHMKILSTTEETYTFEYSFVGSNDKRKGTVTKTD